MEKNDKILEKKNFFDCLPDYIIENCIFSFLTSKELFFVVRSVSSEWSEMMKNAWSNNIKDEMFTQIRNLNYIYEKDALAKTYEFKLQYLYNYRNLLIIYNANANVLIVLKSICDLIEDINVSGMLSLFCIAFDLNEALPLIQQKNKNELTSLLSSENILQHYLDKINSILDLEQNENNNSPENDEKLKTLQSTFATLNKEQIEACGDNCRLIYSFIQGVIEFRLLKRNVCELKAKVDALFLRIQNETSQWPKRKKFFENAYRFLLFSKSSNPKIHKMLKLFQSFRLKTPLMDFKEESYKLIVELRQEIETKKKQLASTTNSIKEEEINIDEIFMQNLLDRRLLLSKKMFLLEKFYLTYRGNVCEDNEEMCIIKGVEIPLKHFLISMVIAAQSKGDKFDEDTILQIKEIIETKYSFQIKQLFYSDEEIEKQKEIQTLKQQKQNLLAQKKQTEQILMILKNYLLLRENHANSKKKYKMILYLLSKIRKGEARALDESYIEEMLKSVNLDEVNFDSEEISETEKNELLNFDSSEKLLKEIEESLTSQINSFVKDENNEESTSNNNNNQNDNGTNDTQ